jgi:transposase
LAGLLSRLAELQRQAHTRTGQLARIVVIQETGSDGFWIHRALVSEGIESHVVDPASIAVSRRHRRAKIDRIDGEALVCQSEFMCASSGAGLLTLSAR